MSVYTVFDLHTGKIIKNCHTDRLPTEILLEANEALLDGYYTNGFIQGGKFIEFQTPPSEWHEFNYRTKQWEPDLALAVGINKRNRDEKLSASDWTQLPDVPLVTKEAWATYRQALRDITKQPGFPLDIQWPTQPV